MDIDGTLMFLGAGSGEPIIRVPRSPAVALCLDEVAGSAPLTLDALIERLHARSGTDPGRLARFVTGLIESGLLQFDRPVPDQAERPLAELADWLAAAENTGTGTAVRRLADLLARVDDAVCNPAKVPDLDEHQRHQARTTEDLRNLAADLGLDWGDTVAARAVTHESVVSLGSVRLSAFAWRSCLDDLDALRRWLGLHDRMLPVRIALDAYLKARFPGRTSVPFVVLHDAIQRDLAHPAGELAEQTGFASILELLRLSGPTYSYVLEDTADPRLRRLTELRAESVSTVMSAMDGPGNGIVAPDTLRALAATWPEWVDPPDSVSCYVQPHLAGADLRLAVNVISGGHGRGWSRWLRLHESATGVPSDVRTDPAWTGEPVAAELSGVYGASVNLRVPAAPYEIHYPFTSSDRAAEERIPLHDLQVRRTPSGIPQLFWVGGMRTVVPVHLGLMADPLLPAAARFMLAGFGRSFFLHPNFPLIRLPEQPCAAPSVTRTARFGIGRLTIQRARWYAPATAVPHRTAAESHGTYLLRLVRWLGAAGIPRRCYVRFTAADAGWQDQLFTKSRKPMYVDFASELLVLAFDHTLRGCSGSVVFEEELPEAETLRWPAPDNPRVTEMIIEVNGGER